jgi:long-chain acyl-CoA synthetase
MTQTDNIHLDFQSIPALFFDACEKYNKKNAIMFKQDGAYVSRSHDFFRQRATHLGRGLMALGLEAGDHVGLLCETRFEWIISDQGILSAGGVVVPLYPSLPPDDVQYILENSESMAVIVADMGQLNKVMQVKDSLPNLKYIICIDNEGPLEEPVYTMEYVENLGSKTDNESELKERWSALKPDDPLTIIYTSGTTGRPKGVQLSHKNLIANVEGAMEVAPVSPDDICLSHLPLSHVLERMAGYYLMLAAGVTIAFAEDISSLSVNLAEVHPTIMVSVPRLFEKIFARMVNQVEQGSFLKKKIFYWALDVAKDALPFLCNNQPVTGFLGMKYSLADKLVYGKIREKTGGRLKFMISGGAALPKEIGQVFLGIGLKIVEGYGLTETSPVLTVNLPDKIKPGYVGPAIKNVQIRIAEDGEIIAKGPNIMKSYYKNPQATKEVFNEDGWFLTGDIGEIDSDGFLKITDRKKDLLVTSGGKNVAPQPMENKFKFSQFIEQCVVIGDGQKFISALIVPPWETIGDWAPRNGWGTDPEKLASNPDFIKTIEKELNTLQKDFARYEQVKKFAILPQYLSEENGELTPSLKIKRKVVAKHFADIIEGFYAD